MIDLMCWRCVANSQYKQQSIIKIKRFLISDLHFLIDLMTWVMHFFRLQLEDDAHDAGIERSVNCEEIILW